MKRKRRLALGLAFALALVCLVAWQTAGQAGFTPVATARSTLNVAWAEGPGGEGESMISQTDSGGAVGVFDFESRTVLLSSGYRMPILGLGTYALDHDACVNSVMALLANGGSFCSYNSFQQK